MSKWEIQKVKTFKGREGCGGLNLDLYHNGVKVAEVTDDDSGGPCYWRWLVKSEEGVLKAMIDQLPPKRVITYWDMDVWINSLVEDYLNDKRFRRICKKNTVYRMPGEPEEEWHVVKIPYDPIQANKMKINCPGVEIMNEKFIEKE